MKMVRLRFGVDVTAEAVADTLRVLAAERRSGGGQSICLETVISRSEVSWWLSGPDLVVARLLKRAEVTLPSLRAEEEVRPEIRPAVAIELAARSGERLLDVDQAAAAVARLLGVQAELRAKEVLLIQWRIGLWLARSPIPPAGGTLPEWPWRLVHLGKPVRDSEATQAARVKQAEPLFAAVGRIAVAGASGGRGRSLVTRVLGSYQLLRAPGVGLQRRQLPSWLVIRRMDLAQVAQISPALRAAPSELAGLVGWPIESPALRGVRYRQSRPLAFDRRSLTTKPYETDKVLGVATGPGQAGQSALLGETDSLRHLHVIGPTGAGKSTVLARLILGDMAAGRGLVVLDPKGDLVPDVLARMPKAATGRVVVLDPTDAAPVGFNPLSGSAGVDGVLHVMASLWRDSWGPRLGDILHASLRTLSLEAGHSLVELPLLLTDAGFRRPLVARASSVDRLGLGSFWAWYEALSEDARAQALAPVMNKLRAFTLRPDLRAVLGQAQPRLDLVDIFRRRLALLVRLPKGQLGPEGTGLIGSLLVAQLWQQAQARAGLPANLRHVVSWYLDEFQDFLRLPVDLGEALVQARGLGVGLVMAHQHLGQLDAGTKAAVLANAGSRLAFRLDHDDAAALAKRARGRLSAEDLTGLEAYEAYASLSVEGDQPGYGSLVTLPLDQPSVDVDAVLKNNRERFGVDRAAIDAHLNALLDGGSRTKKPPGNGFGGRRSGEPEAPGGSR